MIFMHATKSITVIISIKHIYHSFFFSFLGLFSSSCHVPPNQKIPPKSRDDLREPRQVVPAFHAWSNAWVVARQFQEGLQTLLEGVTGPCFCLVPGGGWVMNHWFLGFGKTWEVKKGTKKVAGKRGDAVYFPSTWNPGFTSQSYLK